MGEIKTISISEIRENPVALRAVNRNHEDYLGLVDSMKQKGFFGAITGRSKTDEEGDYYEVLDGLHRFSAAKDAGLTEINMDVLSMSDAEALELQIMANTHKVETRPVEYSGQLRRLLTANPLMTEAELAERLGKSPQWIAGRLGLNKLTGTAAELVNEGKIKLANAYALAKLPEDEVADFIDRAMTDSPDVFVPACNARVKEIREAKRRGQDAAPREFQPVEFMQKMIDVKGENETGTIGATLIASEGVTSPIEAWKLAVKWFLHVDPQSVEVQKVEDEERREKRAASAEKRKIEKAQKNATKKAEKAKEAADEAEKVSAELSG